jgi:hypothetical protein
MIVRRNTILLKSNVAIASSHYHLINLSHIAKTVNSLVVINVADPTHWVVQHTTVSVLRHHSVPDARNPFNQNDSMSISLGANSRSAPNVCAEYWLMIITIVPGKYALIVGNLFWRKIFPSINSSVKSRGAGSAGKAISRRKNSFNTWNKSAERSTVGNAAKLVSGRANLLDINMSAT